MLVIFVRTIIIYGCLLIAMRIMGKRQIGQLDVSDLISTLLISEIASLPIENPDIPIIHSIIPLITLLTFEVASKEAALTILKNVKLISFAESLGGTETLITYPTTQTHADVPKEIQEKNGLTDCILRVSVGIENIEDIIADLSNAFAAV